LPNTWTSTVWFRIACFLFLHFFVRSLTAQGPTDSAISGWVLFAGGKPAVKAHIAIEPVLDDEVSSGAATAKVIVLSRDDGSFTALHLAPGRYRVQASAIGGVGSAIKEILLSPGDVGNLSLELLPLGGSIVATGKTQKRGTLPSTLMKGTELTGSDADLESAAQLLEGGSDATSAESAPSEERDGSADSSESARRGGSQAGAVSVSSGLSFSGLPITQNVQMIDGLSAGQNFRSGPRGAAAGGPVSGSSFAQSAMRTLRVMPRNYSAQYGNAAGALLSVSSRAGTASLHGEAFYRLRTSAFAATNPFSVVTRYGNGVVSTALAKPQHTLNQFGAQITSPVWMRRAKGDNKRIPSLLVSVEQQFLQDPTISTPASASFYQLSATQKALLGNRGVTATAQNAALNYLDSLSGPVDRSSSRTQLFLRSDMQATRHDRLVLSYALNHFDSPAGTGFDQSSDAVMARGRASVGDQKLDVQAFAARWLHTFTTHFSHELRFQWARDFEREAPRAPLPQEPAISPDGFAPQVSIEPEGFSYGTPSGLGRSAFPDERRVQIADEMELAFGHHLLMLGGDWSRVDDRIVQLNNAAGSFLYDSGTTGGHAGGLVDWITDYTFNVHAYPNGGCPNINAAVHDFCFRSFTQSFGGEQIEFVTHDLAGFIEDRYHPLPSLSLSLGMRYEYTLLPMPQSPNAALDTAFANLDSPLHGSTSSFPEDRNNVGPRVSAIWSPKGGRFGTLHLGYGTFFGRITGATVRAALTNTAVSSSATQIRITPSTETVCPQVANQGFGYPCAYLAAPPAAIAQTSSVTLFSSSFRLPAVQRGTVMLEHSAGRHLLLRAEYAASIATQLPSSVDRNIAPSTANRNFVIQGGDGYPGLRSGQVFTLPLYTARRVQQYGPVTTVVSNANATYHAGTIEAALRNWHSLELRASFTFSRSIDYAPQSSATPRLNGQVDPFTNGYDKGLSNLNFPRRFSGTATYSTRVAHGPEALRRAVNGWHFSAVAFATSGAPYSYSIFGGSQLNGGRESLNGAGGATYLPTVGRNTLRLPARGSVDLRVARDWKIGGRLKLTAFAEAFNLLNERNLSRVETRAFLVGTPAVSGSPTPLVFQDAATVAAEGLTTRPFGTPTSSTTGVSRERQGEFGIRLTF
jgi:hypothetical protein